MTLAEILALPSSSNARMLYATDQAALYYIPAGSAGSAAKPTGAPNSLELLTTAARKDLNSYTTTGGPVVGVTRVTTSTDTPGIIWTLVALPVEQDSSWVGQPYTVDPSGAVVVNMQMASFAGIIPDPNTVGVIGGQLRVGDGVVAAGNRVSLPNNITYAINADGSIKATAEKVIPDSWFTWGETYIGFRIGDHVTAIGKENFPTMMGDEKFYGDLVFPDSLQTVGNNSFSWPNMLETDAGKLVFGTGMTSLGDDSGLGNGAFSSMQYFKRVEFHCINCPDFRNGALHGTGSLATPAVTEVHVPVGAVISAVVYSGDTADYIPTAGEWPASIHGMTVVADL